MPLRRVTWLHLLAAFVVVLGVTLGLVYNRTYLVADGGGCMSDLTTTTTANWALGVGDVAAAVLAYSVFVVGTKPWLRATVWRWVIAVPVALGVLVGIFVLALVVPTFGVVPGIDC